MAHKMQRNAAGHLALLRMVITEQKALSMGLGSLSIGIGIIAPAYIWLVGTMVNEIQNYISDNTDDISRLVLLFLAVVALFLCNQILTFLLDTIKDKLRERISTRLQYELMLKCSRVSLSYFESSDSYDKIHRANKVFGNRLINLFQDGLRLFQIGISIAGYLILLLHVSVWLCLLLLVVSVPALYIKLKSSAAIYNVHYSEVTTVEREKNYYEQLLLRPQAAKERKIFALSDYFIGRWETLQVKLRKLALNNAKQDIKASAAVDLMTVCTYGGTLLILIYSLIDGYIDVGAFVILMQAVTKLQGDIESVVGYIQSMYEDRLYINNLIQLLEDEEEERQQQKEHSFPIKLTKGIRFDQVSFRYPNSDRWSIRNVSFHIQEGETVAIIGMNGSGKTTLMKLLAALYHPQQGKIYYDDIPATLLADQDIQKHISAIFQDYVNYELPLKESIGIGNIDEADNMDRIERAVVDSGVHTFFQQLPNGYDTFLSKAFDGIELSGGQWQRVAFARGLMKDAPIVILDEPTSALDPQAELELLQSYRELAKGKTTFLISHRIGSARLADIILVMQDGCLVEAGSHEELVKQKGHYYELYRLQSKWYTEQKEQKEQGLS